MKKLLLSMIGLAAMGASAQTQVTDDDLANAYEARAYNKRITCHDPSIVMDDITNPSSPTYYIYGSHLGRGKTTAASNYQEWTTFKAGEEATGNVNSLFANKQGTLVNYANAYQSHVITEVKNYKGETVKFGNFNAHGWQFKGTDVKGNQWAPDIIYNKTMKKWCMYMSLNGEHWGSVIVCLTSDNIEGPFVYQGPVVFSGFQGSYAHNSYEAADDWKKMDLAIATGAISLPERYKVGDKWGTYWPNCIDPCVFYDDDDNLWLSYGSWSGGIFMLKLDKNTGLRDYTNTYPYEVNGKAATEGAADANTTSDPYFGKKIAGGYYVSGEASYIQKIGKYYFLFMSYGFFNPDGGYQMRIFRSENPDGPYVDCNGTSAIFEKYKMNYSSTTADNRGVLLFGGYKWDPMSVAELAQGHNSAFIDKEGRAFVVYHTKFNDGSFGHQVRVHQLFLNDEGWLMAAPFEFDGETVTNEQIASKASIADADIPGNYQFMRHQYGQNTASKAYETPVNITLNADGTISGSEKGTWERTAGTDYINLTIDDVVYRGVLVKQTIDYTNIPAIAISALSSSSGSTTMGQYNYTKQQEVWAVKADVKAAIKYTLNKLSLPFEDGATLTAAPELPTVGKMGANISWKSSDTSVLTDEGKVKSRGKVDLTMTISKENYVYTKTYSLTVDADPSAEEEKTAVYYPVSQQKNTTSGWFTNFSTEDYTLKKGGTIQFKFYNYSSEKENYHNWCLYGANKTHGAVGYVEYFGVRNDFWNNTTNSNDGCVADFNWDTFKQDMNGSLVDMTVTYAADGTFKMTSVITTASNKKYNYSFSTKLSSSISEINLFFVSECSYIDGSSLATGISSPIVNNKVKTDGKWYNLAGQQVGKDYKGVVIVNGKKFVNK